MAGDTPRFGTGTDLNKSKQSKAAKGLGSKKKSVAKKAPQQRRQHGRKR